MYNVGSVVPGAGAFEVAVNAALTEFKMSVKGRARLGVQVWYKVRTLGFHSCDETAILVLQNNGKMSLKFCIIIESNSQKVFIAIVLYTNMAAVTSPESRE